MAKKSKESNNLKILESVILALFLTFLLFLYSNDGINLDFSSYDNFINSFNNIGNSSNNTDDSNSSIVDGEIEVQFIDVGQADSILIRTKNNNVLIDAGNTEDGNLLVNYFNGLNIKEFKYVFGTHAHEDHIGGMADIIDNFTIDSYYMPDVTTNTKTFENVLDSLDKKDYKLNTPKIGDTYDVDGVIFKVMNVESGDDVTLNDSSIVLKMTYGNTCFMLMGDASSSIEEKLLNKDISCQVLKVGHHGSQYSSSEDFIDKVNPKYAIIEVGKNNSYNHPTTKVLNLLKKKNIEIYRTDEKGSIIVKDDGSNLTFTFNNTNTNG